MKTGILRKPRGDAVLQNQPRALQLELWEYVDGGDNQKGHTAKEAIQWLAARGIKSNTTMIYDWRQFYMLKKCFEDCREMAKEFWHELNPKGPEPNPEQNQRFGNKLFAMHAIKRQDAQTWSRIQTLELRKEALGTVKAKLKLELRKYKDGQAKTKAATTEEKLSPEEKQQRIREILGTE